MKNILLTIVLVFSIQAMAAEVDVKMNKIDSNEDTTISIEKGKKRQYKHYSISEGENALTGDKDVVAKSAEINWKKECNEWKKEFRLDNKDNKIISITCGKMSCLKEGVETTCTSQAKYKIKTLAEE
ncbi:MAG: hypothetical protein H7235_08080 [Bdellovibrionaceae bacterium]|nr:hypothetical protein [Pseudobdellovibrionaceae bacterium]